MPSGAALLAERRDAFRDQVIGRELAEAGLPPTDLPPIDGEGGGGDGEDGLWLETLRVAIVEDAPGEPDDAGTVTLFSRCRARLDGVLLAALVVIAEQTEPSVAACWRCGVEIGWVTVAETDEGGAQVGEFVEWRALALAVIEDGGSRPVNPFCEDCAPFVSHAPLDPDGPLLSAGGWLGDGSRCVRSPMGNRVMHVWVAGSATCVCDGTLVAE